MMEYQEQNYLISADKAKLDVLVIHNFLKETYWAKNVPLEVVEKCFYTQGVQRTRTFQKVDGVYNELS